MLHLPVLRGYNVYYVIKTVCIEIKIILSCLDVALLSKDTKSYMKVEYRLTNVYPE